MNIYTRQTSPLLSELLGKSLGNVAASGLGAVADIMTKKKLDKERKEQEEELQKRQQEQQQAQAELLQSMGLSPELAYMDPKLAGIAAQQLMFGNRQKEKEAQQQDKEQKLKELQQQQAQQAYSGLQDLYSTFEQTLPTDPYSPLKFLTSQQSKIYEDKAKALRSDPLIKKLGIVVPSLGSANPETFQDAFKKLSMLTMPEDQQSDMATQDMQSDQGAASQKSDLSWMPAGLRAKLEKMNQEQATLQQPSEYSWTDAPQALGGIASSAVAGAAGMPRGIMDAVQSVRGLISGAARPQLEQMFEKEVGKIQGLPEDIKKEALSAERIPQLGDMAMEQVRQLAPERSTIEKVLPFAPTGQEGDFQKALRETAGDIGEQVAFMFMPTGIAKLMGKAGTLGVKEATQALKAAGIVQGSGNAAKFLAKKIGLSEGSQEGIKVGTSLLAGLKMGKGLEKIANDTYRQQLAAIPENVLIKDRKVNDALEQTLNHFTKVGSGFGPMTEVMERAATGRPTYKNAMEFLDELTKRSDGFNKASKEVVTDFRKILKSGIKNAPDMPKKAVDLLLEADTLYRSVRESERAADFITDIPRIGTMIKKGGLSGIGAILLSGGKLPGVAVGYSALKGKQLLHALKNFATEPSVRNAYLQMMQAALQQNSTQTMRSAVKLDNAMRKKNMQIQV